MLQRLVSRGLRRCRAWNAVVRLVNFSQFGTVTAECAGGEEGVFGRQDKITACLRGCGLDGYQLRGDIIAREQVHALYIVGGDEPRDLVEHRIGIEGADLRLDLP